MAEVTVEQAFQLAVQHHQAGRLAQAEILYREVLARRPNHADALHLSGVIAYQRGENDTALDLIRRAIAVRPNWPEAHSNLGNALRDKGRLDEAIAACRRAVALNGDLPGAHYNLGVALQFRGQLDEAIAAYRQAIALKGDYVEAYNNLGIALRQRGQIDEAIAAYRQAIALRPNFPEAYSNLGNALSDQGQLDEAVAACRQAIALKPNYPDAYSNLGVSLSDKGQLDEAIAVYRQAIALKDDWPDAHRNLGNALHAQGRLDEAIAACRRAMALDPDSPQAHSNLLFTLHFHPGYDAGAIAEEHRRWNARHAEPLRRFVRPHGNDRDPQRRLRIGYVSGDFRRHVAAASIEPVLAHHDRGAVEVFCYSNVPVEDAVTRGLQGYGHHWRAIAAMDDGQAAELIRADGIDILVDLSLHTNHNRLLVFARKPAPVQATHVGYPGTTGLTAIDCRLTDRFLDPEGLSEAYNSETLVRLPRCWYCYVRGDDPPVQPPPARAHGQITFGSLNSLAKITPPVIELWSRILAALPSARLLVGPARHISPAGDRLLIQQFEGHGISADRVQLAARTDMAGYLRLYHNIDIALDPFPFNGGNVTCDALWMGLPVVTLRGHTSVGRAGVSILSAVGLTELIADTPQEYVKLAVQLAGDVPRLENLRTSLRPRMRASPLTDAAGYTRDLEAAYRQMWRRWCAATGC